MWLKLAAKTAKHVRLARLLPFLPFLSKKEQCHGSSLQRHINHRSTAFRPSTARTQRSHNRIPACSSLTAGSCSTSGSPSAEHSPGQSPGQCSPTAEPSRPPNGIGEFEIASRASRGRSLYVAARPSHDAPASAEASASASLRSPWGAPAPLAPPARLLRRTVNPISTHRTQKPGHILRKSVSCSQFARKPG